MANWKRNQSSYNNNNSNYNNNNRNNSRPQKKRSGAKLTRYVTRDGVEQHLTSGWKLSKGTMLIFMCVTTKKSVESEKGWFGSVACTVTNKDTFQKQFYWGTMEKKTGKVVIAELGLVLNPRARNGGYCGTFINKG